VPFFKTGSFARPPSRAGARTRRLAYGARRARTARLDDSARRRPHQLPFVETALWRSRARSIAPFFKLADGNGAGATHGDGAQRHRTGTAPHLLAAKFGVSPTHIRLWHHAKGQGRARAV
jgi:hypothetical protein